MANREGDSFGAVFFDARYPVVIFVPKMSGFAVPPRCGLTQYVYTCLISCTMGSIRREGAGQNALIIETDWELISVNTALFYAFLDNHKKRPKVLIDRLGTIMLEAGGFAEQAALPIVKIDRIHAPISEFVSTELPNPVPLTVPETSIVAGALVQFLHEPDGSDEIPEVVVANRLNDLLRNANE